jgi:hypothetical protein
MIAIIGIFALLILAGLVMLLRFRPNPGSPLHRKSVSTGNAVHPGETRATGLD